MTDANDHDKINEIKPIEDKSHSEREQVDKLSQCAEATGENKSDAIKEANQDSLRVQAHEVMDNNQMPAEYQQLIERSDIIAIRDATEVNGEEKAKFDANPSNEGKTFQPPFTEGTQVIEIQTRMDEEVGRFHKGGERDSSKEDEGKSISEKDPSLYCTLENPGTQPGPTDTPLHKQFEYATPGMNTHFSGVEVEQGATMRIGTTEGWQSKADSGSAETPLQGKQDQGDIPRNQIQVIEGNYKFNEAHAQELPKDRWH